MQVTEKTYRLKIIKQVNTKGAFILKHKLIKNIARQKVECYNVNKNRQRKRYYI